MESNEKVPTLARAPKVYKYSYAGLGITWTVWTRSSMSNDQGILRRRIPERRTPAVLGMVSGILFLSPGCSTTPPGPSSLTLTREESSRADADAVRMAREILEEIGMAPAAESSRFDSSSHIDAEVFPPSDGRVYGSIEVEWVPSLGDLDCACGAVMIYTGALRVVKRLDGRVDVELIDLTGEAISSVLLKEEYRVVCPGAREPPIRRKALHHPFVLMARTTAYDTRPIILQQLLGPRESRIEKPLQVAWLIGQGDCP